MNFLLLVTLLFAGSAFSQEIDLERFATVGKRRAAFGKTLWINSRIKEAKQKGRLSEVAEATMYLNLESSAPRPFFDKTEVIRNANLVRLDAIRRSRLARDPANYSYDDDFEKMGAAFLRDGLSVGLKRLPAPLLAAGAQKMVEEAVSSLERMDAPIKQMKAQHERAVYQRLAVDRVREELARWYDTCSHNATAREIDSMVFGDDGFTPTSISYKEIVEQNPEIATVEVLKAVDEGTHRNPAEIVDSLDRVLTAPSKAVEQARLKQAALEKQHAELEKARSQVETIESEFRGIESTLDDAENGFQAVETVFQIIGEPQLGRKIGRIGFHAVEMARKISDFSKAAQIHNIANASAVTKISKISTLKLTTDLVGLVGNIISLFSSEPSFEEIVLEQLHEIRSMLGTVREEMHERFDYIDRNLETIYEQMLDGFEKLDKTTENTEQLVIEMQDTLNRVDESVRSLRGTVYTYLHAGFERQITLDLAQCMALKPGNPDVGPDEVRRCFTTIATLASEIAGDELNADRDGFVVDGNLYLALSDEKLIPNPWAKIGLMSLIADQEFGYKALALKNPPLVNVFSWVRFAKAYMELAKRWPDFFHSESAADDTHKILAAGQSLRDSVLNLTTQRTVDGPIGDFTFLAKVLDAYDVKLKAYTQHLASERLRAEGELAAGFELGKGIEQLPKPSKKSFSLTSIPFCPGDGAPGAEKPPEGPKASPIEAPEFLKQPFQSERHLEQTQQLIPAPYLHAHAMGLGTIEVCYGSLEWVEEKQIVKPHQFHKAAFQIKGFFRTGNDKIPIFAKELVSTQYYMSHHVGPGQTLYNAFNPFHADVHLHFVENNDVYNSLQAYVVQGLYLSVEAARWEWSRKFRTKFHRDISEEKLADEQRQKSLEGVSALLTKHLEETVKPSVRDVILERSRPQHPLGKALTELTGAKHLVQAFVSLSLANATQADDVLHSLLFGAQQIMDAEMVKSSGLSDEFTFWEGAASLQESATQRFTLLRDHLKHRVLSPGYAGERLQILEVGIMGLEAMTDIHDVWTPKRPIGETLGDLRSEIDRLLGA